MFCARRGPALVLVHNAITSVHPQSTLHIFTAAEMDALEFRQMLREGDSAL
jgi:hypothetical protein